MCLKVCCAWMHVSFSAALLALPSSCGCFVGHGYAPRIYESVGSHAHCASPLSGWASCNQHILLMFLHVDSCQASVQVCVETTMRSSLLLQGHARQDTCHMALPGHCIPILV